MVVDWGKTTVDQARAALEILEYNVAGVAFNKVDYAEHARRGYGDAVQYYTHASVYYNDKPQPRKYEWLLQRMEAVKDRIWSFGRERSSLDRERDVEGKRMSVRVEQGGGGSMKKKRK